MRRFPFRLALGGLILCVLFLWTACGGSKSVPTSVSVTPNPVSLDVSPPNDYVQLSPTVLDQNGGAASNFTFTYASSDRANADVSTGGLVCAGTWTNASGSSTEVTPTVCTPTGVLINGGAFITVTAKNGHVTLSTQVAVYTHLHVDNVTVAAINPPADCLSQTAEGAAEEIFQAKAFSNGIDVTSTVGTFSWSITPSAIGYTDNVNAPGASQCQTAPSGGPSPSSNCINIAAATPGVGNVIASISGAVSTPAPFVTCPVQAISLTGPNSATAVSLSTTGTAALTATAVDTHGLTLTNVPFTYNSSAPANVASGATVTATSPGSSVVTASCSPGTCNIGLYPVFSNGLPVAVSGTSSTTVYVTGTPASGSSPVVVPIATSTNTAGTAITLGATPNSFIINRAGTKGYMGTESGLITLDTASNTVNSPTPVSVGNQTFVGTVLAVSPDGNWVVTAAHALGVTSTNTELIFTNTSSNANSLFNISNAASVDFSPDSSRAIALAGDGKIYAFTLTNGPALITSSAAAVGTPNLVRFLTQGSFAIVAGGSSTLTPHATCNFAAVNLNNPQDVTGTPTLLQAVPKPSNVGAGQVGAVAVAGQTMGLLTTSTDGTTGSTGSQSVITCTSPTLTDSISNPTYASEAITPVQLIVSPDGTQAFVTGNTSTLYGWNIAGNRQIAISLGSGASATTTGGVTPDSQTLYVGGSDGSVHRITLSNDTDAGEISTGAAISPDFVVVRPL